MKATRKITAYVVHKDTVAYIIILYIYPSFFVYIVFYKEPQLHYATQTSACSFPPGILVQNCTLLMLYRLSNVQSLCRFSEKRKSFLPQTLSLESVCDFKPNTSSWLIWHHQQMFICIFHFCSNVTICYICVSLRESKQWHSVSICQSYWVTAAHNDFNGNNEEIWVKS